MDKNDFSLIFGLTGAAALGIIQGKGELERLDLDQVLADLKFGQFQLKNLIFIGLLMMFANLFTLSFTLTTADLDYRCFVPECETLDHSPFMSSWIRDAIPFEDGEPRKCKRFKPNANISLGKNNGCTTTFHSHEEEYCENWIFATNEVTVVKEFGIFCENQKWKLSLIGTINYLGQLIGTPLFGIISDRFGRKSVVIVCSVMSSIFGIIRGLSTSYLMFALFEFLDSFFGCAIYSTAFILGMELVNTKMRPMVATIIEIFYPFGSVIMGGIGWYFQNWRKLLIASYSPGVLFILYIWLIPESIRWLYMKGRCSEAHIIIRKISTISDVQQPNELLKDEKKQTQRQFDEEMSGHFWEPIIMAFQSKHIQLRLIKCSFLWFASSFVYCGLSINSVELVGNKYLNFIQINAIEVPAIISSGFILNKTKRRKSQRTTFFLCGLACILCEFVPTDMLTLRMVLYLTSKFLITISFCILFVYSTEMFPTQLRLTLLGVVSTFGRVGSMVAPQTILIKNVAGKYIAVLLFGVVSIIAGTMANLCPETSNKKLPDTLDQAELEDQSYC